MSRKKFHFIFLFIFVMAFVPRLLVFAYIGDDDPRLFYTFDSEGYVTLATNMLNFGVFSSETTAPFTPNLSRTPIYPLMLASVFATFGTEIAVIMVQLIIGSTTALLVFLLARELRLSPLAGLIAACLIAVEPVSVLLSNRLLTETLFTQLLIATLCLLARYWNKKQLRWLVASAIVFALAALTRPIAQFLPLALLPLFAIASKKARLRTLLSSGLLFVVLSTLLISTWAYRNYQISGVFTLSTIADINLMHYRARSVLAKAENISQEAAWEKIVMEINAYTAEDSLTESEKIAFTRRRSLEIFRQYPVTTALMLLKGVARMLFDPGYTITCTLLDLTSTAKECFPGESTMLDDNVFEIALNKLLDMTIVQQVTLIWSLFLLGVIYLGAMGGFFCLIRQRNWKALALLTIVLLYLITLSAGSEANYRFRTPIMPFLVILAGIGYQKWVFAKSGIRDVVKRTILEMFNDPDEGLELREEIENSLRQSLAAVEGGLRLSLRRR